MALSIASINSGSNGNCYYVANENEAVLIDVGISCREIEKRMTRMGLSMQKVKAIFISHEHIDHVRGAEGTSKKHQLPVYITEGTRRNGKVMPNDMLVRSIVAYEPIVIGGLTVTAFPKLHDAADPHSFVVEGNGVKIGVLTDIGSCCDHVVRNFKDCHAAFLESNYDEEMLENGRYPQFLKDRISGTHGHLSNKQALDLFIEHKPDFMSHVFLSHLSRDNNRPQLAYDTFAPHAGRTNVIVASRDRESQVFQVYADWVNNSLSSKGSSANNEDQLSLFGG